MKRVLALLLALMLCIGVLASCTQGDGTDEESHVHTFKDTWTSDAEGHWYEATCACTDITVNKLQHADKNNDGACDVCEYKIACANGHSYAEEWTVDCTNHWHAADCGHIVAGSNVWAHADTDGDGKCDVCAYVINDIHTHYFDDEWSSDASSHWHAALCEHGVEVADKAAHNVNAAGYCTVCGAKVKDVDKTDFTAMLNAAIANNGKVVDASVLAGQVVYSGSGDNMYVSSAIANDIYFVLGNDASYVYWKTLDANGEYVGAVENWYELVGEDEVFGAERENGDYVIVPVEGTMAHLNGYSYYPGSILPSTEDDTSTLANTLAAIYALKTEGTRVSGAKENYDAQTGVYSFEFSYFTVNAAAQSDGSTHYQVEVYGVAAEFTFDENFVIDSCNLAVCVYRNIEQDMDLDYDPEKDTYTLRDDANPSFYVYEVSQRSGERTFTNPYPKASLIPTDFDLYNANVDILEDEDGVAYHQVTLVEKIDKSVSVEADSFLYLALSDLTPSTAYSSFIDIEDLEISFVNNTSGDSGVLFTANESNPSYSKEYGYIAIFVKDAGDYTLTVKYDGVVKTFDVEVTAKQSSGVEAGDNEILVETTDTYGWFDEYTFVAEDGEGKYTFTLPAGLGFCSKALYDSFGNPECDYYSTEVHTVEFELEADEELVFYVGAIEKNEWIISYSYEACEVDSGSQGGTATGTPLTIGNTQISASDAIYTYTAAGEGTLTLTPGAAIGGMVEISYTVNGGASTTLELSSTATLELNEGDVVVITIVAEGYSNIQAAWDGPSADPEPTPEPEAALAGTYTATDDWGNSFDVVITDTTITFTPPRSPEVTFTYEYENGVVTIYSDGTAVTNPGAMSLTVTDGAVAGMMYNMTNYTVAPKTEGDTPVEPEATLAGTYTATDSFSNSFDVVITDTTITFTPPSSEEVVLTYEYADGIVTLYVDGNPITMPYAASLTVENDKVTGMIYNGTTYTLAAKTEGDTPVEPEPTEPDGTSSNPYVIESFPLTLNFTGNHDAYYVYTATADGTITITCSDGCMVTITAENYEQTSDGYVIYATEGEVIKLNPWTMYVEDTTACTYEITLSAPVYEGTPEKPATLSSYNTNYLDKDGADTDGYVWFTYNSWTDGTLTVDFSANVDIKYGIDTSNLTALSSQNKLVIDITSGSMYYVLIKGASTVTFEAKAEWTPGTENNPYVIESLTDEIICNYAGSDVWYKFVGGTEGGYVTLASTYETAKLGAGNQTYSISYNDSETYGSVRFYVKAGATAYVVIGDYATSDSAEIPFTLSFVAGEHDLDGSYEYPYAAAIDDNTCSYGGGYDYVWYTVTTTETGYLTVSSENTNAYLVVSPSPSSYADGAKSGTGEVSYGSNAGKIYIGIKTVDYAAADIAFKVSFEAGELEPDGSTILPFTAIIGENTCAFPGGTTPLWYTVTVDAPCTITVSSDYVSSADSHAWGCNGVGCAWIVVSPEADTYADGAVNNTYSIGSDVTFTAAAAGTYYISIADWCEASGEIVFNVSVTAAE